MTGFDLLLFVSACDRARRAYAITVADQLGLRHNDTLIDQLYSKPFEAGFMAGAAYAKQRFDKLNEHRAAREP